MNREEQIAAARKVAEDNPEWTWDNEAGWLAGPCHSLVLPIGPTCSAWTDFPLAELKRGFGSTAAAIRALGLEVRGGVE